MSEHKGIGWMYDGVKADAHREDYLLGKTIDKNFEKYSDAVIVQKEEAVDALVKTRVVGTTSSITSKISSLPLNIMKSEDPLVAIKVKEESKRRDILENPLTKMRFQKQINEMMAKKEKQLNEMIEKKNRKAAKKEKKRKRDNSSSDDDSRSDEKRKKKNKEKKHKKEKDVSEDDRGRKEKKRKRRDSSSEDDPNRKDSRRDERRSDRKSSERKEDRSNRKEDIRRTVDKKDWSDDRRRRRDSNDGDTRKRRDSNEGVRRMRRDSNEDYTRKRRYSNGESRKVRRNSSEDEKRVLPKHGVRDKRDESKKRDFDSHIPAHLRPGSSSDEEKEKEIYDKEEKASKAKWEGYGLVGVKKKEKADENKDVKNPYELKRLPKFTVHEKREKKSLTEEEKAAKLKEMESNAQWRDDLRMSNARRTRIEDEKEEKDDDGRPASFVKPLLNSVADELSMEDRLKSRKKQLQRGHGYMDKL